MMDWLAKILKLPDYYIASSGGLGGGVIQGTASEADYYIASSGGLGGGVIQGTASEAILVTLLSARNKIINEVKEEHKDWSEHLIRSKLVIYCSEQVFITMLSMIYFF